MAKNKRGPGRPKEKNSLRARRADRHAHPRRAFHAPVELFERLEAYCKGCGATESQVIRDALHEFLKCRKW